MCGICGSFSPNGVDDRSIAAAMLPMIRHRGPDEVFSLDGETISAKLARLGMIGLSRGWQPVWDRSNRFVALTNGEVFNSPKLRSLLGMEESENSVDVAVIPELIAHFGISGLRLVDGQFATAIVDTAERTLYLARDRFGICPLMYTFDGATTHFCSELKPLVRSVSQVWRVNMKAVSQYLALGNVVAPSTMVSEINAVPPGCAVRFDGTTTNVIRYWRYGEFEPGDANPDEIYEALADAVQSRIHADVEIGAYLSGGFDSSALVALAAKTSGRRLQTFSSVFEDPLLDESKYQREVVQMYNTEHHEVPCRFDDTVAGFESMVRHCCAPQRESYNVAAQFLSSAVRNVGIKGVLSGEGADELFFGYDSYAFDAIRRRMPEPRVENESAWGLATFSWEINWADVETRKQRYLTRWGRESLLGNEFWRDRLIPFSDKEVSQLSPMQLRSIIDVYIQLSGHLLGDHGDAMLMSHSVEGRYPFLSNRLVDLAIQTADCHKIVDFEGKACIKHALSDDLPESVLYRGKQGFTAPPLRNGVPTATWTRWTELVHASGLFDVNGLNNDPTDDNHKWDFGLSVISISMIIDELGLVTT